MQLSIYIGEKRTFRNTRVTDIHITHENVVELVRGGRARWKIENECFIPKDIWFFGIIAALD